MSDQAERLRQLVGGAAAAGGGEMSSSSGEMPAPGIRHTPCAVRRQRGETLLRVDEPSITGGAQSEFHRGAQSLLFTSGKGGVGTSNIVLNLAIALGELSWRVVVVDADIGLANLDLLGGFYPRYDLGDILLGRCELSDAFVPGPGGIQVVPGAHASRTSMSDLGDGANRLVRELDELEHEFDFVLIDAGSGLGPGAGLLAAAVSEAVVVTTPEPTAVADAHAAINRLHQSGIGSLRLLVNQAASRKEAVLVLEGIVNASRQFKGAVVSPLGPGFVQVDPRVPMAVRSRRPFVTAFPAAVASRGVRRLAQAVIRERHPPETSQRPGFRAALPARWRS